MAERDRIPRVPKTPRCGMHLGFPLSTRMNQELEVYLRYFVSYYQNDWEQLLPITMLAINSRTSSVTGFSPFFAIHGYDIKLIEIKESLKTKGIIFITKEKAFISKLKNVTKMAQTIMAAAQEKYEIYANTHRQSSEQFKVGDKVWLNLKNIATNRPCKKLD
jgi:hypothetical protein